MTNTDDLCSDYFDQALSEYCINHLALQITSKTFKLNESNEEVYFYAKFENSFIEGRLIHPSFLS